MNTNVEQQLRNARPALDLAIERAQHDVRSDDARVVPLRRRPQLFAIAAVVVALAVVGGTIAFVARRGRSGHPTKIALGGSATATLPPDANAFSVRLVVSQVHGPCEFGAVRGIGKASGCYNLGPVLLNINDVVSATASADPLNGWGVDATFTSKRMPATINQYVGQQLAIVVDGQVVSAPVVDPGITGTAIRVSGLNETAAKQLAARLSVHH